MPQCPYCNAAVWVGQHYCATCLNYLPRPEEERHFCPQCGIRVASPEELCPSCATLPEIAGTPSRAPARVWRLPPRGLGLYLASGLVFLALVLVFLFNQSQGPLHLMATPSPQAPPKPIPAAAPLPKAEKTPAAPMAPAVPAAPAAPAVPNPDVSPTPATSSPAPAETAPKPAPPRYFVNVPGLALREGPTMSATQISTLYYREEVELLDTSEGWGKVRDVKRNIVGWSARRYLQAVRTDGARAVSQPGPSEPEEEEDIASETSEGG
ncbi:MAG: SH3 domain-containing protein [Thermodesulfobacteriota bacterium]